MPGFPKKADSLCPKPIVKVFPPKARSVKYFKPWGTAALSITPPAARTSLLNTLPIRPLANSWRSFRMTGASQPCSPTTVRPPFSRARAVSSAARSAFSALPTPGLVTAWQIGEERVGTCFSRRFEDRRH